MATTSLKRMRLVNIAETLLILLYCPVGLILAKMVQILPLSTVESRETVCFSVEIWLVSHSLHKKNVEMPKTHASDPA